MTSDLLLNRPVAIKRSITCSKCGVMTLLTSGELATVWNSCQPSRLTFARLERGFQGWSGAGGAYYCVLELAVDLLPGRLSFQHKRRNITNSILAGGPNQEQRFLLGPARIPATRFAAFFCWFL